MLSAVVLFKDILPGYRIRTTQELAVDSEVVLKKETKILRDYEQALLGAIVFPSLMCSTLNFSHLFSCLLL